MKELSYQILAISVSNKIYEETKKLAKEHGYSIGEYVYYAILNYISISAEFGQWGEKIKHFQKNINTLINESSEQRQIILTIDSLTYSFMEKYARCRGMCIVKWIENHLDVFYQNRINSDRVKQYITAGQNDSCPCGSGLKFKKCCGPLRDKGRKPTLCPECAFVILEEEDVSECLCKNSHIYN